MGKKSVSYRQRGRITISSLQANIVDTFANSADPDETANPSHQDLRCLPLFAICNDF